MRLFTLGRHAFAACLAVASCAAFAVTAVATPPAAQAEASAKAKIPSPVEKHRAIVDALRANDVEALVEAVGEEPSDALAKSWEEKRVQIAQSEREDASSDAELVRVWAMLATREGTAKLAVEWHPLLVEHANTRVIEFNLGLAAIMTGLASDAGLKPEETQQLSQVVLAVQRWANGMDWQDRARFDRAVDALAGFVRRSGLETPREVTLLPFEEALALGDDAIATVKRVLLAYDLDVDATLASMTFEELARDGDRATVRTRFTALGVPVEFVREMRYHDRYGGRWINLRDSERYDAMEAETSLESHPEIVAPPKAPVEPESGTGTCKDPNAKSAPPDWQWSLDE